MSFAAQSLETTVQTSPMQTAKPATRNLLLVDDDTAILRALTARLTHAGYEVSAASNASIALTQAEQLAPDVALLDINMPGIDGFKLAEALRERRPDCVCIFLTASRSREQRDIATVLV